MRQRTLKLYFILQTISLCLALPAKAQTASPDTDKEKPVPVFCGVAVSADIAGLAMKAFQSKFSQMEAAVRINLKEKYFPTAEIGYGMSDYTSEENNKSSSTHAPYFRVGMDYNFTKKRNGNRLYAGLRYGYSAYRYDLRDESFQDPVWSKPVPFHLDNAPGSAHWGEIVFGLETRLWKFIQLGWNIRYKTLFTEKSNYQGSPWYIPGFGKNGSTCFGGTFNILFEI